MARQTSWLDIIPIFVLFLIFLALTLGALYGLWNALLSAPDLVYDASPVTQASSGSFFVTITITNESSSPAHLVTFWLHDLGTEIKKFEVESQSPWNRETGGRGRDSLLIKWERLAGHSQARVRLETAQRVEPQLEKNFSIDSEEGAVRDKSRSPKLPWKGQFLIFVFVCAGFISLILSPLAIGGILDRLAGHG